MSEAQWSILGWAGTVIFVASFLVKDRAMLHFLGMVGCIIKLRYTYHYQLWPLVVNWVLLIVIEFYQWMKYKKDHSKPTIEEFMKCQM